MNTIREQNYCETICRKHRECGYYIRGLQRKCKELYDYFDGYDKAIDKACEWIRYNNENGGCLFDGWEKDFRKTMER